jgi:IPT/TIG domain/Glucose / Sorbosone dehydrogenase
VALNIFSIIGISIHCITISQKENYFSAATLVAYLADPDFDGNIKYDKEDDGNVIHGFGVEVYAAGLRNPFGLTLHSNGYLYATDNGPNLGYGDMKTGCGPSDYIPDIQEADKIALVEKGRYYGHPNYKRGESDPRQCKWRSVKEPSDSDHTAPILVSPSAMTGITEFTSNHFDGQLRFNLITCKYTDGLFRVVLTLDGRAVIPESAPIIPLQGDWGLDVTQAPNGVLIQSRMGADDVMYFEPIEPASDKLEIKSVFPKRGGESGGNKIDIYGVNFEIGGALASLTVLVGGKSCHVVTITSKLIVCIAPGGVIGTVDVVVTNGSESSLFERGYRYISGRHSTSTTAAPSNMMSGIAISPSSSNPITIVPTHNQITRSPLSQVAPVTIVPVSMPVTLSPTSSDDVATVTQSPSKRSTSIIPQATVTSTTSIPSTTVGTSDQVTASPSSMLATSVPPSQEDTSLSPSITISSSSSSDMTINTVPALLRL